MDNISKAVGFFFIFAILFASMVHATDLRIGVSQSVIRPIEKLCLHFEKTTPFRCKITTTSTGHLYAQSMHSNLFDVLIGSIPFYTMGLIQAGKASSKYHYALARSRVVLWSSDPNANNENLYYRLTHDNRVSIVVPDPKIANYGIATKQTLQNLDIWAGVQKRLVLAPSIRHTYRKLQENPNQIGFVSMAQLSPVDRSQKKYWEPDDALYEPVVHDLILMNTSANTEAQMAFLHMIEDVDICPMFESEGYLCELKKL